MRPWRRAALLLLLAVMAPAGHAQQASEAAVKAAFLHKFLGYIEWPAESLSSPDAPLVVGVTGNAEVAAELERVAAGRTVGSRRVVVRRLAEGDSYKGLSLLFVGRGEPAPRAIFRAAQQEGVLAVAESERGLEQGAAIAFVVAGDRVAFDVSLEATEKAGPRISARMLAVARRVVPRA